MRYRDLFRTSEFAPLFATVTVGYGAVTTQGLALAVLVYDRTGSPLLAALSMFGSSTAQLLGALTLLSLADRVRPRPALTASAVAFAAVAAIVATPGLSTAVVLALVIASGLVTVVRNGVQWGLLTEILPTSRYVLGRSLFTMSNGVMQMLGFGFGGLLVAVTSPRTTLLLAASAHALSAAIAFVGIGDHRPRAGGKRSVRTTWAANRSLCSEPRRRRLFVAMWVPNGLIVGCEALFVPYSRHWSGVLFAASAAGMLAGDLLVARVMSAEGRARSRTPLRLLLAVPYLAFALHPPIAAAGGLVLVASLGYGATLVLQEELLCTVPRSQTGHALGLHSCGLLAMQALGASLAGTVAGQLSPQLTMTSLAVASIAVTLTVSPARSQQPEPTTERKQTPWPMTRNVPSQKPSTPPSTQTC
jgi:MFS family permease